MTGTFHIKNFDRLQHYKDRSPPWIKLYNGLLDDYAFAHLPDASKAHLIAIGLLASRYSNKIPLDADWIAKRINATSPVDLPALIESGFIVPDQPCSNVLATGYQDARPEREGETQVQREIEKKEATAVALPEWINLEAWAAFLEMRKKKRAPVTPRAIRSLLAKLTEWRLRGHDPTAIIDSSVTNAWTDFYEPKGMLNGRSNGNHKGSGLANFESAAISLAREFLNEGGDGENVIDVTPTGRPLLQS